MESFDNDNKVDIPNQQLRPFMADGATVHWDQLARNNRYTKTLTAVYIANESKLARRPLTELEANTVAQHASNASRWIVWSKPAQHLLALGVTVATRRNVYRFIGMRRPIRSGFNRQAIGDWAWRFVMFDGLNWIVFAPTAVGIAGSSLDAHARSDPALQQLKRDRQAGQAAALREVYSRRTGTPSPNSTRYPPSPQQQRQEQQGWGEWPQNTPPQSSSPQSTYGDPGSSYGGGGEYSGQPTDGYANYGASSSSSPQQPQPQQQRGWGSWPQSTPSSQPAARQPSPSSYSRGEPADSDPFDEDDASPVAPSARGAESSRSSPPTNTWDRIRQEAKSDGAKWSKGDVSGQEGSWAQYRQDKTPTSRDSTPKTDGFSYSNEDEERERKKYEKEQAQKEFDALVDADRQGGNGSRTGSTGRWR